MHGTPAIDACRFIGVDAGSGTGWFHRQDQNGVQEVTGELRPAPPAKDGESEQPIPMVWRPTLARIVEAFASGDFGLDRGIPVVAPVSAETASQIRMSIADYGATLAPLPDQAWDTSVCIWYGDHWSLLVDLWTEEEGRSDLVLDARVTEAGSGYRTAVHLVYVP
ncbi:DUF7668 domain-containing protein [Arenimonas metalli]|uniref:DUF7668 domain-containing protein n=1 Tax=Arenimonas metalli CF5-1 TaxID=1384056 RepID=A0A091B0N4_9GAMM|nr:hypothetical protein [Arenimonas metalli]KFN46153.1 hypothetical protein N787_11345 [Arenimonas metalli CF5-1]